MNSSWLKKSLSFIGSTAVAFSMNSGLVSCCPGNEGCENQDKHKYYNYHGGYENEILSCEQCCEEYNNSILNDIRKIVIADLFGGEQLSESAFLIGLIEFIRIFQPVINPMDDYTTHLLRHNQIFLKVQRYCSGALAPNQMCVKERLNQFLVPQCDLKRSEMLIDMIGKLLKTTNE